MGVPNESFFFEKLILILHEGWILKAKQGHDRTVNNVQTICYVASFAVKGQLISEWIYEVIVSPKIRTKNCQNFCPV